MNINIGTGFRAAVEFTLESSFFEGCCQGLWGIGCLQSATVEVRDLASHDLLRGEAEPAHALIATGEGSSKIGGEDRILQLIQNPG